MGKTHYKWAIVHSYVKLPEGIQWCSHFGSDAGHILATGAIGHIQLIGQPVDTTAANVHPSQ